MAKRYEFNPFIVLTGSGDGGSVIGGGTGQGGVTIPAEPMSYEDWLDSDWAQDYILDDNINEYDYAAWWDTCNFSQSDWVRLNPNLPWDDYF